MTLSKSIFAWFFGIESIGWILLGSQHAILIKGTLRMKVVFFDERATALDIFSRTAYKEYVRHPYIWNAGS